METLRERIASVFQVHLPISRGTGRSIADPVIVRSDEEDAHFSIMKQWMHFKGLLEEKELTVFRTVPIIHHGRHLIRVDVRCNAPGITAAESKTEHFYFDVSSCIHQIPFEHMGQENISEENEEVPKLVLFDTLDEYLDFYLDDEAIQKDKQIDPFKLVFRKCGPNKWTFWCESLEDGKAVGEYIQPFTPSPDNLRKFHEGATEIARRLMLFRKSPHPQSVPISPSAFGDMTFKEV